MASSAPAPHKNSWDTSTNTKGEFVRKESQFRRAVTRDGSSGFPAEAGRYHLYVSYACPWAHRTLIVRRLKGLEKVISYSTVHHFLGEGGWRFGDAEEPAEGQPDPIAGRKFLREVYLETDPNYTLNVTVPVLYDTKTRTIVNNESPEIIRMLNSEFNDFGETEEQRKLDLYPEALRPQIDEVNAWVYPNINNGVYRCGFATTQEAYSEAFGQLFAHLDKAEEILSRNRYLAGSSFTEADVRLFTTLIRFDAVYVGHFKTNLKRIADYPNLQNYIREIYQKPGIKGTVNFDAIKIGYYRAQLKQNPSGIVPLGPILTFDEPHNRASLA